VTRLRTGADNIRFERNQYAEVHAKWNSNDPEWENKKTASDTYGAEHLMRLLGERPFPGRHSVDKASDVELTLFSFSS
jgi:hypothetical protein